MGLEQSTSSSLTLVAGSHHSPHPGVFIHIHLQLRDPLFLAAREAGELLQDPLLRWRRFCSSLRADLTMTFGGALLKPHLQPRGGGGATNTVTPGEPPAATPAASPIIFQSVSSSVSLILCDPYEL